jgi:hypothetical protein
MLWSAFCAVGKLMIFHPRDATDSLMDMQKVVESLNQEKNEMEIDRLRQREKASQCDERSLELQNTTDRGGEVGRINEGLVQSINDLQAANSQLQSEKEIAMNALHERESQVRALNVKVLQHDSQGRH